MRLYTSLLLFIKKKLSKKQFLFISCILVGLTSGLAAILLKTVVFQIHSLVTLTNTIYSQNYLYILFPLAGILLTIFVVKYFLKDKFKKGSAQILFSIAKKSSIIEKHVTYTHLLTSAITVGFGGSAGLEAPIVVTGAAIGSNYGRINRMDYRDRTLLLACGSAAGIAAVFNAPIAGIMFAVEIILTEATLSAFVPLIISAVIGALCSKVVLNEGILLVFTLKQPFNYFNIPFYILLGLLAGMISVYYANVTLRIEKLSKLISNRFSKGIIGGVALGLLVFLFPPLFGEGYTSILPLANLTPGELLNDSLFYSFKDNEWFVLFFIGMICLIKVFATSITLNFGGNGGNFAPSLFVGAYLGFAFSRFVNLISFGKLPESNFTLVGMAGILSGVMYAPLTGIFLIAEITGGYELMIPLMIVSAISYGIVRVFEPYSMDTRELAKKGEVLTANKDKNILTLLDIHEIIETDFAKILYSKKIFELTELISHSKRNLFPVVDEKDRLLGIVYLENIREILFELTSFMDLPVVELMKNAPAVLYINEDMASVMKKFDESKAWNLPVLKDGKYIGFISKSSVFASYREQIIKSNSE